MSGQILTIGLAEEVNDAFGVTVAERIRNQFEPLFDPASEPLSPEITEINDYVREHAGYPLYDAQLAVAESVKRQLQKDKCAFIVAECGSGKTKIGSVAMAAALNSIPRTRRKTFNIIRSWRIFSMIGKTGDLATTISRLIPMWMCRRSAGRQKSCSSCTRCARTVSRWRQSAKTSCAIWRRQR